MTTQSKQAVDEFMNKSGHHDTTVHEAIAPGITHENVQRTQHENVTTAVDKEIHQNHYHTSVQPVTDKQVLPEQHSHNVVPIEHRSFEHGDPNDVKARLAQEQAKFKDERVVGDVQHTHSVAPVVQGEHIHHHVHETIQPVVQKQTIEPKVVHTTVPVHETHSNAAQHHSTSALPAVSMSEFRNQGGSLTGREERQDAFEGEPRSVGGALSGDGYSTKQRSTLGDKVNPLVDSNKSRATTGDRANPLTGSTGHSSNPMSSSTTGHSSNPMTGSTTGHSGNPMTGSTTGHSGNPMADSTKPRATMGEKMNPMVDSDRDGRKGVMD